MVEVAKAIKKVVCGQKSLVYLEALQVRAVEMPNFPVVDDVSTIFGMRPH